MVIATEELSYSVGFVGVGPRCTTDLVTVATRSLAAIGVARAIAKGPRPLVAFHLWPARAWSGATVDG
jgi:hypothetical protein